MNRTQRRIVVGFLALAAIGVPIGLVIKKLQPGPDEVVLISPYKGPIKLLSRQKALGKAPIDFTIFGKRFRYPDEQFEGHEQTFKDDPSISGVLFVSDMMREDFKDVRIEVDGQQFDNYDDWGLSSWDIPYVFGTSPKTLRVRPNPKAPWMTLRVPPNGKVLATPPDRTFVHGDLRVRLHYRPMILPTQAPEIEVFVQGSHPGQKFAVSSWDLDPEHTMLCGDEPGILHLEDWSDEEIMLDITPLLGSDVILPFTRTDEHGTTSIQILNPKRELLISAKFRANSFFQSAGDFSDSNHFYVPEKPMDLSLEKQIWTGLSNRGRRMDILLGIQHGVPLKAKQYKKGTPVEIPIKFDLPPRDLFNL